MNIFLGITGASGAPYARRLLQALSSSGAEGFANYVKDPSQFGNNVMPKFGALGDQKLQELGEFLNASKGPK